VKNELDERELFPAQERSRIAEEIMAAMASFLDSVCSEGCPHRCFDDPKGDGRAAFYAEGLPWCDPTNGPVRRGRNEA
jgi:hypothetical protein